MKRILIFLTRNKINEKFEQLHLEIVVAVESFVADVARKVGEANEYLCRCGYPVLGSRYI